MDFLKYLTENFWMTVILLLFIITMVSIVMGIGLEAYRVGLRAKQKLLELRNEELRLQLKLSQQNKESSPGPWTNPPRPKEAPWMGEQQGSYEMGYQQQEM